ncbi:STAS domain-containing protein [Actinoplanes sp. TBRC 11911]|uniref:STAS domain-containing protein n=1 Tax=Actinoplanes sp. TBRC 11911 TaxID=2729386 RepID=UPI00145D66E6|nr:STAS domain-containing protein [Actinoplanes sp. TBRC 11911]NMO57549.1 STAS domain-containing protein [Actinoplanes sp. TBRC 11911]
MGEHPVTRGGPVRAQSLEVRTRPDGSVIIHPHGSVGLDKAVELRQLLVHTVRHVRPLRLILDLTDVGTIDAINVGTLVAACNLGDDHQVAVFVDNPTPDLADRLRAAGVPPQRLRHASRAESPGRYDFR